MLRSFGHLRRPAAHAGQRHQKRHQSNKREPHGEVAFVHPSGSVSCVDCNDVIPGRGQGREPKIMNTGLDGSESAGVHGFRARLEPVLARAERGPGGPFRNDNAFCYIRTETLSSVAHRSTILGNARPTGDADPILSHAERARWVCEPAIMSASVKHARLAPSPAGTPAAGSSRPAAAHRFRRVGCCSGRPVNIAREAPNNACVADDMVVAA